ncbi:serine protease ea-like isoform X1 [Epargyreus clarus]|uniref:serine protease ea-like isoform X1 n=1 Tax=Epargyreus clarus TaxID=520877 RepID=UPI003C2F12F8
METIIIISSLCFVGGTLALKKCSDCKNYDECPAIKIFKRRDGTIPLDDNTILLIRKEICGTDEISDTKQICCSSFEDNFIKVHPNLELLPKRCGNYDGNRIIGGKIADILEFPWMALIAPVDYKSRGFMCGGSIIQKHYILTAGHCVHNKMIGFVRVGEYDMNTTKDCQFGYCANYTKDISVEKVHVHPDYAGMPNLANDIALLRLAEPIDLNQDNIDAVCLPTTPTLRQQSLLNGTAFVAGWGLTENKTSSSILLKANLTVNSNDNCLKLYNRFPAEGQPKYTENKLCAGRTATGTCTGDSGGPLMLPKWFNRGFKYVQYGIISEGKSGCGSDFPELFTDVTKYMSWILNTIAK